MLLGRRTLPSTLAPVDGGAPGRAVAAAACAVGASMKPGGVYPMGWLAHRRAAMASSRGRPRPTARLGRVEHALVVAGHDLDGTWHAAASQSAEDLARRARQPVSARCCSTMRRGRRRCSLRRRASRSPTICRGRAGEVAGVVARRRCRRDMPAPKLRPGRPSTTTRPPVMYSQPWSPTPSTTAVDAAVADAEALAGHAAEVDLAAGRAVEGDVADDDVVLGDERGGSAGGWTTMRAAGQALADVVVGVAVESERHAARHERAEALAGRAVEVDDGSCRRAGRSPP